MIMLEDKIKSELQVKLARTRGNYNRISAAFGVAGLISVPLLVLNYEERIDSITIVGMAGCSILGGIAGYGIGLAFQHGIEYLYRGR